MTASPSSAIIWPPRSRRGAAFAAVAAGLVAHGIGWAQGHDGEPPAVTPYRPSISTPAELSAPGWLEVEAGVQRSRADEPARRDSLPATFKLAFTPDWGIRLGADLALRERDADGARRSGFGDTTVVLKRRFAADDDSAFGLEIGVKAPTARRDLGSGRADQSLNAIYSADVGSRWHTDLNLTATRLGGPEAGSGRWQAGWAAALARSLDERWGVVGELSGTAQRGEAGTALGLMALSYSPAPAVSFDLGVSRGLNRAGGGWSVFSGLTFLAGRWF